MASHGVTITHIRKVRVNLRAMWHGKRTTSMKAAPFGNIDRTRNLATRGNFCWS
jgi:hypothetical protein